MSEAKCRKVVRQRSNEICEICSRRAHHMHHRINRSQGGRWTPANIMHICAHDHAWIGDNVAAAVRNGWSIQGTDQQPDEHDLIYRGERVFLLEDGSVMPMDWDGEAA